MKEHDCEGHLDTLKMLWQTANCGSRESLGIYRCRECGQLWKIRRQDNPGTGQDDVWLKPGEGQRGYEFTVEEAAEAARENP